MRRGMLIALALGAVVLSCGRTGLTPPNGDDDDDGSSILDRGDGEDGNFDVPAGQTRIANECEPLVQGSGASITVADGDPFRVSRRALALQVQDVGAVSGDGAPAGGTGGAWDVVTIVGTNGNQLAVSPSLSHTYSSNGGRRAQLCTMPQFERVQIGDDGRLAAAPWDGDSGGVVAFFVRDVLVVGSGALVSADQAGFRGGLSAQNGASGGDETQLDYTIGSGLAGGKGEGLDSTSRDVAGRGNFWNAGGGGNNLNAGGGGGGNAGAGGSGGVEHADVGGTPGTNGLGGTSLAAAGDLRVVFGGGGGAGHRDDNWNVRGGSGGGIVFLLVNEFEGGGGVSANGDSGPDVGNDGFNDDGGGGGGAGGTIVFLLRQSSFSGFLRAGGGRGANVVTEYGPGGGGGGGRVHAPELNASRIDVSRGSAGTSENGPRGATAGEDGLVTTSGAPVIE